jgi:hypothetical protein
MPYPALPTDLPGAPSSKASKMLWVAGQPRHPEKLITHTGQAGVTLTLALPGMQGIYPRTQAQRPQA